MDENLMRHQFVNHFLGRVKNPNSNQKNRQSYTTDLTAQHLTDHTKPETKLPEYEGTINKKQRNINQDQTSGGDADRMLYYPTYSETHYCSDSYRHGKTYDYDYRMKQLQADTKPSAPFLTTKSSRKYETTPAANNGMGDHRYLYENASNLDGVLENASEDSSKSQKSSKTVVSRKSSQDLRKIVASQCKLHEVIDETLKQMTANTDVDTKMDNNAACDVPEQASISYPLALSQCKRCTDRMHSVLSQKDVMTEIVKGDLSECRNNDRLTISVDDVVNSKVIYPMVRKLQRMYMNNLKEEMSLMEDLERLPYKVNELYKATIFKQKD